MDHLIDHKIITEIEDLLQKARAHVAVEEVDAHKNETDYQSKTVTILSKELTKEFGKGFSRANIWNMITFYKEYGNVQTLSE